MTRETAIVLCIPETEALVESWRLRYDSAAALGVPAHITLLYPFVSPDELPLADLDAVFADVEPFDLTFRRTNRFGDQVLFLDPEPDAPMIHLIRRLSERFGLLPYGGTIPLAEVKPHLTVVDGHPGVMDDVDAEIARGLPIASRVTEAWTLTSDADGRWTKSRAFAFRGG